MVDEVKEIVDAITNDTEDTPLEVTIKKDKVAPQPDFDYDDYTPSDQEILDIEKEIQINIEKRTKHGT